MLLSDICDDTDEIKTASIEHQKPKKTVPWIDKYRPRTLDSISQQTEIVKVLQTTLKDGDLPHLLLYGPPGTGKTTTIHAIAYQLFGKELFKERVMELNASDERGIGVVRSKIINFAKSAINSKTDKRYPPYKIIILDEADTMTTEAQRALRKTMEDYSAITRFCFICNYVTKIIYPIISRCSKFRFTPLNVTSIVERLDYIRLKEGMVMNQESMQLIGKICDGDLRKAIMLLQNLQYIKRDTSVADVYKVAGYVPDEVIDTLFQACKHGSSVQKIREICTDTIKMGHSIKDILVRFAGRVINDTGISEENKAHICICLCDVEKKLLEDADEYIQFLRFMMTVKKLMLILTE